jgi:hypothetical protein
MQKLPVVIGLTVLCGCGALGDVFTAHPDVVVRVDGEELTVSRFAEILVLGQPLPLRADVADELARHWVNVTLLSQRAAAGDSLMDTAMVTNTMWFERRQYLLAVFREQLFAGQVEVTPETVDSAYRVGDVRVLAHVLRRVTPETTPEEKGRQLALTLRLHDRLVSGGLWEEANAQSEDSIARVNNGSLGLVRRGQTVPRFENAAFALRPGDLSPVTETEYGYHIIYRPTLEEVRDLYTLYVGQATATRLDSAYGAQLMLDRGVEVLPTAPATVREITTSLERALESSKVLATYDGGRFTSDQFARWLMYVPPETYEQLLAAPDDQIAYFTRQLVLQELLWQQADSAGIGMSDSTYGLMEEQYRLGLQALWGATGLWPDSLAAYGPTPAAREQLARQQVDRYFEAVASRQLALQPVPPALAEQLRQMAEWRILPAGIDAALQLAGRLQAATERPADPQSEQNVP